MVHHRISQLFFIVILVCFVNSLKKPLLRVSGMSDKLPKLCRVDKGNTVNISMEAVIAACDSSASNVISDVRWTIHKLQEDAKYKIDEENPHKKFESKDIHWTNLEDTDLSVYAIQAVVKLENFDNRLTIMGYLVIGCGDTVGDYAEGHCSLIKEDVKNMAGDVDNIWHLRKCNETVSTYIATSLEEITLLGNAEDAYAAGRYLLADSPFIFQVKSSSEVYILLHKDQDDKDNSLLEVVLDNENKWSLIRNDRNSVGNTKHIEENGLLSGEDFSFFWISFVQKEVRVGKGHLPYVDQILLWDKETPEMNYISVGTGLARSSWKLDIDLCLLPLNPQALQKSSIMGQWLGTGSLSYSEQSSTQNCDQDYWKFNKATATCEATCDATNSCFKSEDLCNQSCSTLFLPENDCVAGEYYDTEMSECKPCPEGQYQDEEKQTQCKQCPAGTSTSGTGSEDSNACTGDSSPPGVGIVNENNCVAGKYYDTETSECKPCPEGQYQDEEKQTTCKQCSAGTSTSGTGSKDSNACTGLTISISCTHKKNCLKKNPTLHMKFGVDCEECSSENLLDYSWSLKECNSFDIQSCDKEFTGNTNSLTKDFLRIIRSETNANRIIKLSVTVTLQQNGQKGEATHIFQFSPIPSAGNCIVEPMSGYTLFTNFSIICTNFTVEGNHSFEYMMQSNTENKWAQGSRFYTGHENEVTGVKLSLGDPKNEHRLFIIIRARLVESGTFAEVSKLVQVLPSDQAPNGNVIEVINSLLNIGSSSETSFIDDLLAAGNDAEAVQNLNVITSALNPVDTSDVNDTETEEKTEIRTVVVKSLEKVNISSFETMTSVAQTLNEVTKVKSQLSESTQDRAADLFENLADGLNSFSDDTEITEVVDTAGEVFTGVTQLLDIKVDEGSKHLQQNKTDVTDSVSDDMEMEKVKKSAGKLLNTLNKVSSTLLTNQKTGDPPLVIETESTSLQVEKVNKSSLNGRNLTFGNNTDVATMEFPSVMDGLDKDVADLGLQVLRMKRNPYIWDKSATGVNMEVLSVELTSENTPVKVSNLSQPVKVTIKTPEMEKPPYSTLQLHIKKTADKLTFGNSTSNVLNSNFTVPEGKTAMLSLYSFFQMRNFKLYIDENEKPSFDRVMELGVAYPDQADELNKNLSKFELTNGRADNSSLIFITYNKSMSENYTGTYFLALTVDLQKNETIEDLRDLDVECIGNDTVTNCETILEVTLEVDTRTLTCTYWDETSETWTSEGCEVSPFSTKEHLECLCTHLTAFSGGVFVLPNFVDPIEDAALFLTFFDNPVVVTTVIIVWVLYFFLIHWARQMDKKDKEQVGVIAVGNVDAVNRYKYLVCVVTGWWADAGTTANVYFYLKGKQGSSSRTKLTTSARLCFQSGYEDWFLVSTEESLGDLENVTIWHDNSGTSPHWYFSQVFVKDLQQKKSWTFIYNDWLAVDRGSALLTTVVVPAVSKEELKLKQKHNFMVKTTQDLRDSHLWISIFSKPARSTFTRVQRLTCALSLLLTTMLTNIMFYGIPTDDPEDQIGGSRGLVISLSSVVIGIQSSLLMFPINLIIMQMFLKLKQRPVKQIVDKEGESYIQWLYGEVSRVTPDVLLKLAAFLPHVVPLEEQSRKSDSSSIYEDSMEVSVSSDSNIVKGIPGFTPLEDLMLEMDTDSPSIDMPPSTRPEPPKLVILSETKETGKFLPWWFLYISWFLVLSVSLTCSYFVMLYGLKFGYQLSVEWLVSFFTGFSQSALITQPLKVLAVAVILTLVFKRTVEFEDYGPEVKLDEDAFFVNSVNKLEEPHIPFSQPLSAGLLQKIKKRVELEWLMDVTIRDILLYIIYVIVVCIVVHGHRDIKEAYYNSVAIEDVFINPGCINPRHCFFFSKVDNVETFYKFINEVAVPNLADMSISDHEYATPGSSHFLVGPWRLRQVRVDRGTCGKGIDKLYGTFNMAVKECSGPYWLGDEEQRNFGNSWNDVLAEASDPPTRRTFQSAWKLKTIPFAGKLATYSGGGYIITMPSNSSLQEDIIKGMWNSDWIDVRTRAVFLEFTLYNPNADLFSVVLILFEFSNNGAVLPYHQIFSTRLYHYSTEFAHFVAACEVLFLIFNISFTYIEWKKLRVLGRKKYFEDSWSYIEIIQIVLSFSVVGLFFQRLVSVNSVMKDFRASDGDTFISFYTAISWDFVLGYVMAFLVALVTLKAVKLLKFNKRTYMVADTIAHSKSSIASFVALAVIVAIAFGHFATLVFGKVMDDYRNMTTSLITIFKFALGVSDYPGLAETNRILGPAFYCIYVFMITFIFLTVFVAILNFGISESKAMFEKRQNKFELLEYIKTKLKTVLNIKQ